MNASSILMLKSSASVTFLGSKYTSKAFSEQSKKY